MLHAFLRSLSDELPHADIPTLLIFGAHDKYISKPIKGYMNAFHVTKSIILKDKGHRFVYTSADVISKHIDCFVEESCSN